LYIIDVIICRHNLIVVAIRGKIGQIRTHIHTKKYSYKTKIKIKKVEENTKTRPKGVGAEGEKKRKKEGRGKEEKGRTKKRSIYSCAILCAQRLLFARLFFVRSVF